MLASSKELLERAQKQGYAIGAFNTSAIPITKAIFSAAEKLKSPLIIQTSEGESKFGKISCILAFLLQCAKEVSISCIVHQDHCRNFEMAKKCIESGYQSILADGSALSYDENVAYTKKVADLAHAKNVYVEGELGAVGRGSTFHKGEIPKTEMTDPDQALDFVKKTGVDSLAISFGNIHGVYEKPPQLDFERLKAIRRKLDIPLVLHGSSGIKDEDIKKAISLGISKINVNTNLRMAFADALRKSLADPEAIVPYKYMLPAEKAVQEVVEKKIELFGSAGRM